MSAQPPQLWSLSTFREKTGGSGLFSPGRGMLAAVDGYLSAWNGGNCASKSKALVQLMSVCRSWLDAKQGKGTSLANKRRAAVEELAKQAFARLQYESFEDRKAQTRAGPAPAQGRGLQGGYAYERTTYLNSGKTQALSGSSASALIKNASSIGIANPPNFSTMSQAEFTSLIQQYAGPMAFATEVEFFTKADRMGRLIVIRDGRMHMGANAQFDTAGNEWAWAMDTYGNFFSTDQEVEGANLPNFKRFNHSSLNAGKDVVCAGIVRASGGYLTHIDNASGHYKPARADVVRALKNLQDFGYDFGANVCAVRIMEVVNGNLQWSIYRDARKLIANAAAPPDAVG